MSERDEYRECMARELEAADEMAGELGRNSYSYGKAAGLRFALHEYDRLAPDREREKKALVWFQAQVGRHPGENGEGCDVCPYYACEDDCLAEYLVREAVKACILPAEAANV